MKIPELIKRELDSCGQPYNIKQGARHHKIFVNGIFCGIFPMAGDRRGRAALNVRAQIRRAVKGINEWMH